MYLTINTRPVKAIKEHKLRKRFKISRFYWRYLQNTDGLLAIVHLPLLRPCPEPVQSWDSLPEAWPCLGHQIKQGNSQVRVEQSRRKRAFIVCNINNRFKRLKWVFFFLTYLQQLPSELHWLCDGCIHRDEKAPLWSDSHFPAQASLCFRSCRCSRLVPEVTIISYTNKVSV